MTAIMAIAAKHGLKVVEDCAQSFGSRFYDGGNPSINGKQTGTIGEVGAFSFFPSKNLGAYGDGGLVATNDDRVAEVARMLRAHGAKKKYHNEILGYNSRLDTIQAAILRVKLPYIDKWNEGRRRVAQTYRELLADVAGITTPEVVDGHVFHQYTIRVANGKRDELARTLNEQGIGTMVYYPIPQDQLPVYKGKYPVLSVSEMLTNEVLSLPIWPELGREMQSIVIGAFKWY
jgi:dTDP-4-amino-4,6-dideoxygalactose transaminase